MRNRFLLAWRSLTHHRMQSAILMLCIALIAFLPLAVEFLIQHYSSSMTRRANETPLLVGAKGSRVDLLLNSLYFQGRMREQLSMADLEPIRDSKLAQTIGLYVNHTARTYPIVGTQYDYFAFRNLRPVAGTLPLVLGDAVLGAKLAAELDLGPGDGLISDTEKLYDLSASYPLKMKVTGVLNETGSADDWAVFADLRTVWILAGVGHGHQNITPETSDDMILKKSEDHVAMNASVVEYNEITPENIDSFHFHGGPELLPLTAVLVIPHDPKSRTILQARLENSERVQPVPPTIVLNELLELVFRIKKFFDANLILVSLATVLFLTLIVLLSLRVRRREMETLFKIGCSRGTVFWLWATELGLVLGAGLVLAAGMAAAAYWFLAQGPWIW